MSQPRSSSSDVPLVTLDNAQKRYADRVVLHIQRLELFRDECLLITGANGSGKSTLLRVLSGVAPLSGGSVTRAPEYDSLRVCYVPQTGGLYPTLTLADNLRLSMRLFGTSEPADLAQPWYVRDLGLDRYLQARCDELSGGYQRLAAIACAFVAKPHGLFIDEPLSGIDRAHGDLLLEGLESARNELAFIVLTNHSAQGLPVATRAFALKGE